MRKALSFILALLLVTVPAFALNFVPSIEAKLSPDLVQITDENGEPVDFVTFDEEGKPVDTVYYDEDGQEVEHKLTDFDYLDLYLTSIEEISVDTIEEIKDDLYKALSQTQAMEDASELSPEIITALSKKIAASSDPLIRSLSVTDLVVTDLFDISLVLNGVRVIRMPDGSKIRYSVQTDYRPGDLFFILNNCEGDKWNLLREGIDYTIDENGVVTFVLESLCPFVFLGFNKELLKPIEPPDDPNKPLSPATGEANDSSFIPVIFLNSVLLLTVYRIYRKRQTQY